MIRYQVELVEDLFSYELLMTYKDEDKGAKISFMSAIMMRRDLLMMVLCQVVIFTAVVF